MHRNKKIYRHVSFDKVIELCHRRIRTVASNGGMNTFFEIPGIIVGYPLYNIFEACDYTVNALRKNGLLVQILPPPHIGVIYISWDPQELEKAPPRRAVLEGTAAGPGSRRLRLF